MRNVILGAAMSLDGYIARRDGGIDFISPPHGYSTAPLFATIDVIALGRKTFDDGVRRGGGKYKPPVTIATYVFSRTQPGERDGVVFTSDSPATFVSAIRKQPGKDVFVMGGGELARSFLQDDVVDELHLGIYPVLLGSGIPLFPSTFSERKFQLLNSQSYDPDGFLELRYSRKRS